MIKILNIEVNNFKSLFQTKIDQFGVTNLFYGYNNSGKSNIFKFLKLLFERKKIGTSINYLDENSNVNQENRLNTLANFWSGYILDNPFLFSKNNRRNPIIFQVELEISNSILPENALLKRNKYLGKETTKLLIKGKITSENSEVSFLQIEEGFLNGKQFFRAEDKLEYFFEGSSTIDRKIGEVILALLDDLVLLIDSDRNFVKEKSKDGVSLAESKDFKNGLFELYINAEKNDSFNNLINFLSTFKFSEKALTSLKSNVKSFPFNENTEIGFARFEEEMEIMLRNNFTKLPLKNFGTGIQQFLFLLAKIHFNNSKIVIIEELELNLSPLYQKELLTFLKSLIPNLFSQLLFSSHSPYFTQKEAVMIDIIHHVQIDYVLAGGTSVECYDDIADTNDAENDFFYFND